MRRDCEPRSSGCQADPDRIRLGRSWETALIDQLAPVPCWCASRPSATLPPAILHRGAHAADRARGRSRSRPSYAARRRGAAGDEGAPSGSSIAGSTQGIQPYLDAFRQGLRELGYVEGQSIAIEYRSAEGKYERLADLAAELVRMKLDVIVAVATPAVHAAKQATKAIPIVMLSVGDPVATGFVASVARPGGNITGLANIAPELVGKQLQLLREVLPKLSVVGVLWNPANPSGAPQLREAEAAARALGVPGSTLGGDRVPVTSTEPSWR